MIEKMIKDIILKINKKLILSSGIDLVKLCVNARNDCYLHVKGELPYLEVQVVDHCNLNCKGCSHFSSIAKWDFYSVDSFEKDMQRMSSLFKNIHQIRLLGGEPTLHPEIALLLQKARNYFPLSDIRLVTNGMLLPKMDSHFWTVCKDMNIVIDITVYPPLSRNVSRYRELAKKNGVCIDDGDVVSYFTARINVKGDSDERNSFINCRKMFFCPFLKNGFIYVCGISYGIRFFNQAFQQHIPEHQGVNIYESNAREIIHYLFKPIESCKWCSEYSPKFEWSNGKKEMEEWLADTYMGK
jgi:hypothetical protein